MCVTSQDVKAEDSRALAPPRDSICLQGRSRERVRIRRASRCIPGENRQRNARYHNAPVLFDFTRRALALTPRRASAGESREGDGESCDGSLHGGASLILSAGHPSETQGAGSTRDDHSDDETAHVLVSRPPAPPPLPPAPPSHRVLALRTAPTPLRTAYER